MVYGFNVNIKDMFVTDIACFKTFFIIVSTNFIY